MTERVQFAAGTVLHDDAREMRRLELGVESGKKRMIKHFEDLPLHLGSRLLLLQRQSLLVHHFHGVKARGRRLAIAPEATEVDGADVAGAEAAVEAEISVSEGGFLGANDGVGEVGGPVRLESEILGSKFGCGSYGCCCIEGESAETATAVTAH